MVISEGFARAIAAQGGAADALRVLPNWVREESFEVRAPARLPDAGFKIVFAGTLGLAQGLEVAVEAAERLAKRGVSFIFVGEGVERARLRDEALRRGLANVCFLPAVAQGKLPAVLAAADALLVHLRPDKV
ncbi:MAG: glycosyltransferase [Rubrobacter sp.]|nr:glycosyltransferase [Rubrobacter sp.]